MLGHFSDSFNIKPWPFWSTWSNETVPAQKPAEIQAISLWTPQPFGFIFATRGFIILRVCGPARPGQRWRWTWSLCLWHLWDQLWSFRNFFCSLPLHWYCVVPHPILAFLGPEGIIIDGNYWVSGIPLWFLAMTCWAFSPACPQWAETEAATAVGRHRRGLVHLRAHLLSPLHHSPFNRSCSLSVQDLAGLLCLPSPPSLQGFLQTHVLCLPSPFHWRWFAEGGHAWCSLNVRR